MFLQPGLDEVIGDHLGSRSKAGLDPRLGPQPAFVSFLGDQPGGNHHARIGSVGAAGDGSDHHIAIADVVILALNRHARRGLVVNFFQIGVEHVINVGQRDFVLRALGAGQRRDDRTHVEFQRIGEHRVGHVGGQPQSLFPGIGFDQRDLVFLTPGQAQVSQRLVIDPEEPASRAVFRGHVGERGAVGQAQFGQARTVIFHKPADDALGAQHLRSGQHQIGRGHAFGQGAGQLEPDHFGDQHGDRLTKHRGFGFNPADAPAEHAETVDHRGVAIGPDAGIGIGDGDTVLVNRSPDGLRDVLQIDLVADPGARRYGLEIGEASGAPLQKVIALAVAVIFDFDVLFEGLGVAEFVDHHRMVDHQMDRDQRVDLAGITAEFGDCIAHRGQIDHAGHPGEILQQHPRRAILDFVLRGGRVLLPVYQGLDIGRGHCETIVFKPQQVFQQHLHAERQAADIAKLRGGGFQRVIGVILAPNGKRAACAERVLSDLSHAANSPVAWGRAVRTLRRCNNHGFRRCRCARTGGASRGWGGDRPTNSAVIVTSVRYALAALPHVRHAPRSSNRARSAPPRPAWPGSPARQTSTSRAARPR